jgi:hypothetical protein
MREATIRSLRDSQVVRLVAPGLGRRAGRILQHSDTHLVLARAGEPLRVASATIDSLWIRGGATTKKGAIVGGLIGGVAGVGLGLLVSQGLCNDSDCDTNDAEVILGLGLGGLSAGTLVGALIGSAIPKWHRRLP